MMLFLYTYIMALAWYVINGFDKNGSLSNESVTSSDS